MAATRFLQRWLFAMLALLVAAGAAMAQDVLPVPPLSGRVIDQTATLSDAQRAALTSKLAALEEQTGTQLVVLIVPTTQPEDIAAYGQRVGDQWKIGRATVGDGLIIVVAKNDRKVRIEVAKTLEGAIPDLAAKLIIKDQITPAFKAGDFAGGLNAAVDKLAARIKGEALPAPTAKGSQPHADESLYTSIPQLAMFFFLGVPVIGAVLSAVLGRKIGSLATSGAAGALGWFLTSSALLAGAAGALALILVGVLGFGSTRRGGIAGGGIGSVGSGMWGGGGGFGGGGFSSGSSSSSSGGGFSSGGGGDFGGGGASGDW
jgi:uncharacterized protein